MKATRGGGYKGTEAEALGGAYVRCTIFDVRRWRLAAPMYEVRFGQFGGYAADLAPGGARWQAGPAYVRGTKYDLGSSCACARVWRRGLVVMILMRDISQ